MVITQTLLDIEQELRKLQLWEFEMPSVEALSSVEPFAIDTLRFPQWLQFIFLPRLHFMIEQGAVLPTSCSIAPIAQEYFHGLGLHSNSLIAHLQTIDNLLTENKI